MRPIAWLICAYFALAMPALAQDKATIEKLNQAFATALAKGDYAAAAAIYTEDAYLLPPGAEMKRGRAAIQEFWSKAGEGIGDIRLAVMDLTPLGGAAAREIGTFSFKTKEAQPSEVTGKYVAIWQKVGNDWKLATDIWNMNK